ncbi:MAG: hypothetical protein GY828_07365 [Candidatus Gracilibacteria bacterium]|nr:hypothetical protein [Candidatus Gracilibacteria bacterium]
MNLFKRTTASIALVALVSSVFTTGASAAYTATELDSANMLAEKMIINSVSDNADYRLGDTISRAEMAKIAAKIADVPAKTTCDNSFSDISATTPNDWVCGYVEALLGKSLISANANYNPNSNISKSEAVKLMLTTAGETVEYTDATWQADFVAAAVAKGYVSAFSDYNTSATRGFVFSVANSAISTEVVEEEEDDVFKDLTDLLGGDELEDDITEEDTTDTTTEDTTTVVVSGDSELMVELSPNSPMAQNIPTDTPRVEFLSFDITAGSEDVEVKSIDLEALGFGGYSTFTDVSVYSDGVEVADDSENIDSDDGDATIDLDDVVIRAGSTQNFVVVGTVATASTTYGLELVAVNTTSASVEGLPLSGELMSTVNSANLGSLVLSSAGSDVNEENANIGQEVTIASFDLKNDDSGENVELLSVKLTQTSTGTADLEDAIVDAKLVVDGVVVADEPAAMDDDTITFAISSGDVVLNSAKKEKVTVEVIATMAGEVNNVIHLEIDSESHILAKGLKNGFNAEITGAVTDVTPSEGITIEGSEIEVSFDKNETSEVKPGKEGFLFGTITFEATDRDYEISSYVLELEVNTEGATGALLDDLYLGGDECDLVQSVNEFSDGTFTYECKDIDLNKGEKVSLEITADINEDATEGDVYTLDASISDIALEDEEGEDYTETDDDIFSDTSFNQRTVTVEDASVNVSLDYVNTIDAVVGADVIAYKGDIEVGDAEELELTDLIFTDSGTNSGLTDVVSDAILVLNGTEYDADINDSTIEFSPNVDLAAGEDYEFTVIIELENDDDYDSQTIALAVTGVEIETEDESYTQADDNVTFDANEYATITITGSPSLTVEINTNEEDVVDYTHINKNVVAGTDNVALALIEFDADDGDVLLEDVFFEASVGSEIDSTSTGTNIEEAFRNISLVTEDGTVLDKADVSYDATSGKSILAFESMDFKVEQDEKDVYLLIVADVKETTEYDDTLSQVVVVDLIQNTTTADWVVRDSFGEDIQDDDANKLDTTSTTSSKETTIVYSEIEGITISADTSYSFLSSSDKVATLKLDVDNVNEDTDGEEYVTYLTGVTLNFSASNFSGALTGLSVSLELDGEEIGSGTLDSEGEVTVSNFVSHELDGSESIDIKVAGFVEADSSNDSKISLNIEDVTSSVVFGNMNSADEEFTFTKTLDSDSTANDLNITVAE